MAATEAKVKASTTAAAISGMTLWVLGKYVFKGDVPDVLASWVYVIVPGLLAWAAGYWAPHTYRPPPPQQQPVVLSVTRNNAEIPPVPVTGEGGAQAPPV
jgi:drug/metabolite transporter (DMT)-like permease